MERKKGYRKIANRWRRILSSMLVLAMLLSSVPTTGAVYAAELPSEDLIEISEISSGEESSSEVTVESSVAADEEISSSEGSGESSSEDIADETESVDSSETADSEAVSTEGEDTANENTVSDESGESAETESTAVVPATEEEETGNDVVVDNSATAQNVIIQYYDKTGSVSSVNLAGSFNGWSDSALSMTKKDSVFGTVLSLAPSATAYEYKFLPNGSWEGGDNRTFTVNDTNYPIINGNEVTFRYESSASSVYLAGSMNTWSSNATPMTKGDDGAYTYTATFPLGAYQYKFVAGDSWNQDPLNPSVCVESDGNQNSLFIVTGLESYSASGKKGEAITLPSTLDYVPADSAHGTVEEAAVTYSVKTEGADEYVTIDNENDTVTVDASYTDSTLELAATTEDGASSIVTLNLVDQMYNYTIYAYSHLADKIDVNESVLHIWGTEEDSIITASDYVFTGTEEIDGKTWLKTEVSFPSTEQIGMIFREKAANTDGSQWCTQDLFYENTEKAENTTLYIVDGQSSVFTDIASVKYTDERYVIVEYVDNTSQTANVYTWDTGYGTADYDFVLSNGAYIAKIPVLPSTEDKKIGFIVKTSAGWDKDGGDNFVTMPSDQKVIKVKFSDGVISETLPYNMGSSVDRSNNIITFYYRDDAKFADNTLSELKDKVQIVIKSSTGDATIDGTFDMSYDEDSERFVYTDVPLVAETDYYYYYLVDGVKVLDLYNEQTITVEGTEYSLLRNVTYELELLATVKNASMDYNDNNLLSVSWEAKEGESLDGFVVKEMYADLSELGLGSKAVIDPALNALTIGCREDITAGEKNIKVTVVDNAANTYTTTAKVTVTERIKAENTEDKLGDFDWDEAVIYFAVTDRFFDGNTGNNTATAGYDPNDSTDQSRYHGGDLVGLTAKIDYLYDLGVNTIWLTPIVDNVDLDVGSSVDDIEYYAYHGYWAEDFTKLNPHMGSEDELKALIDAAHAKGMKIMVDVVLNHAGYEATDTFNTILKDKDGNYIDMVRGEEDTISGDMIKDSLSGLPDFLTENEEVRNQLIEWQTYWMTEYDIDYYRVDTVKHVDNTTWSAFKNALTESNPEFKMIGEYYDATYTNQYDQLDTGRMDSLLDFGFKYYAKDFALGSLTSAEANLAARNSTLSNTATMGSFLSSHDENGLLYTFINDCGKEQWWAEAMMKVAATLQITAKGQPVIYYGEEIGMTGQNNYPYYDNRYDFDWDKLATQQADDSSMYNHYKKMLNIRRDHSEVFAKGDRRVVAGSDAVGYEVVRRSYEGTSIYVGMNIWGEAATSVTFPVTGTAGSTYTDVYSNQTYTVAEDGTVTISIPAATDGGTAVLVLSDGSEAEIVDTNTITLKLHYNRSDGDYTDWNAWLWTLTKGAKQYDFALENGEMVATMEVEGRSTTAINYIIRKGEWLQKDVDADQSIDVSDVLSGTVHFYVNSGVAGGTRVLGADAITGSKIVNAAYDRDTKKVTVTASMPISGSATTAFTIKCVTDGVEIGITEATVNGSVYTLTLDKDISSIKEVIKTYTLTYDGYEYPISVPNIYIDEEFENAYTYDGDDLGAAWNKDATTFKVWAPTADAAKVAIYESGTEGTEDKIGEYAMTLGDAGVWSVTVNGNLEGYYYTYLVTVNNEEVEACDPYARTTGVNGKRAMIIDLDSTDPEGWSEDKGPHKDMTYTDAVIYELHVRDASIHESSGVSEANKGKYLGLTELGTTTSGGVSTALDHIKDLGVTHVHLLPVYDYGSVDETRLDEAQYNWGYDPVNYNVPEGSYSTDPYNGEVRVKEFKRMVKTMHDNNINVVMDVVYNHVYDADSFCFNQIVPKYFSRTNADGSYTGATGCGNDTASERNMVRKYIVDSVLYWAEEYHIDGFRFDLVGILDTDTMNEVIEEVHKYDPDIIFYGEGWDMTSVEGETMATQGNASKVPELAFFSDTFRDNLAGNNTNGQGFVMGYPGKEDMMNSCFTATTSWCPSPTQTVNYASCHDNYTLKDKLNVAAASATEAERIKMNNLSAAMYMMAEGIPFIHAGEEFLRTKVDEDGEIIHNSYKSSDYVNAIRWSNLENDTYADVADYYKGLIEFRKNHEALRLTTSSEVAEIVSYHWIDSNTILFEIEGKSKVSGEVSDNIVVIFNANKSSKTVDLSAYGASGTEWKVCIDAENAGTDVLRTVSAGSSVTVDAISALVLIQGETVDMDSVYGSNVKETVSLDQTAVNLKVGATAELNAIVSPAGTTVTWSSDNEDVATVDAGIVMAVAAGKATITAQTPSGSKAECVVTVSEDGYFISEDEITLDLTTGETKTLSVINTEGEAVAATWSSVSGNIASVDENGTVTPVGVGTTTIEAVVAENITLTCQVTVMASLTSISVTPAETELYVGETAQLTVTYNPSNAQAGNVTWLSSNASVASVDNTGLITAVAPGTATITATVDGKKATATVKVRGTIDGDGLQIPEGITAVTNIHSTLDDITLPEGWSWMYGDTPVKAFAGLHTKNFQAVYEEENCDPVEKEIPVSIVTVSKINITADAAVVEKGGYTHLTVEIVTTGGTVPEELVSVEWKSSKPAVARITDAANATCAATFVAEGKGSTNITASVTIADGDAAKTFKSGKKSIKVIDTALADISFKDITEFEATDIEGVYKLAYVENAQNAPVVTIASTSSKVTIKSSDAKVVKVGRVTKNEAGDFVTTLTIKKAGYVKLTAVANDAAKTQTSIELYVKDAAPNISTNTVELNNKSNATASVYVYPNEDYAIESVSIDSTDFTVTRVDDTDEYVVAMANTVAKKNYKQTLSIKVQGVEEEYQAPLTVKVASKDPAVKIKQTAKVNLFYTDAEANGSLAFTSNDMITNVTLSDCGYEYDYATGQISVKADGDSRDKKGVLTINLEGYAQPVTKNITIATQNKKPAFKLSAKSGVLYPNAGIENASVMITDVTTGNVVTADEMEVTFKKDNGKDAYDIAEADNTVTFTRKDSAFTSKVTAQIAVARANFTEPVVLTYAISVKTAVPAIALDRKTITLNKSSQVSAYENAVVSVSVKDAPTGGFTALDVQAANAKTVKEFGTSIDADINGTTVKFSLKDVTNLKKGSYKFDIIGKNSSGDVEYKKATVTVKVVDVVPEKTVKLSKSGNIDVLNRDTTSIVYKPKLSNITGSITNVSITGRSAHLFKAELVDGNIVVTVKGDSKEAQNMVNLVTKYNYGIKFSLTLDNGTDTHKVVTAEQKFKLTQSKPKVTVIPKQTAMFNTVNNNQVSVAFSAANKDGSAVAIDRIELTNFTNAFAYDKDSGILSLTGRGEVVKGKNYSLKFNVYCEGCADSEKPITVTYKVKVN